jgi:hypothetical protein
LAISVSASYVNRGQQLDGKFFRRAVLTVSGMSAGAGNTIPHGLPAAPVRVGLNPGANGLWGETQPADATNIYVTVGSTGHTGGIINVEY